LEVAGREVSKTYIVDEMIEILDQKISKERLGKFLGNPFPEMIKFVVDIEREIIAVGGEFHADAEALLLENGSKQENIWGGNLYIDKAGKQRVEFSAMINIRPTANNRSMLIEDEAIR
jgi:hypothetical protein